MNLDDAARLGVLSEVQKKVAAAVKEAKQRVLAGNNVGDRKTAVLPDGTKLGSANVKQNVSVKVEDESAFLAWVKATHPSEVVETVRDSFRAKVLKEAKESGELPPGTGPEVGDPYVSYLGVKGADEIVAARWRELSSGLLGIEGDK